MSFERVALVTGAARGHRRRHGRRAVPAGVRRRRRGRLHRGDVPPGVGYPMATPDDLDELAQRFADQVLAIGPTSATARPSTPRSTRPGRSAAGSTPSSRLLAWSVGRPAPVGDARRGPARPCSTSTSIGVWNTAAATVPRDAGRARTPGGAASSPSRRPPASRGCSAWPATTPASTPSSGSSRDSPPTWSAPASPPSPSPRLRRDTPMLARHRRPLRRHPEDLVAHQGIRRLLEPEEIAATIASAAPPPVPPSTGTSSTPTAASGR